jgi:hypothetical protein
MPRALAYIAMLATAFACTATRAVATSVGTLDNFDVVNDTPSPCHGFEIEMEDIHPSDVPYTFGGSYIRYGAPEVLETTVDPAHPRVLVRYRLWNGTQWEATPVAPPNVSPQGHDCYASGPIGNYLDSGCEHFGVSLSARVEVDPVEAGQRRGRAGGRRREGGSPRRRQARRGAAL